MDRRACGHTEATLFFQIPFLPITLPCGERVPCQVLETKSQRHCRWCYLLPRCRFWLELVCVSFAISPGAQPLLTALLWWALNSNSSLCGFFPHHELVLKRVAVGLEAPRVRQLWTAFVPWLMGPVTAPTPPCGKMELWLELRTFCIVHLNAEKSPLGAWLLASQCLCVCVVPNGIGSWTFSLHGFTSWIFKLIPVQVWSQLWE